jgi:hypothetical protein
MTWVFYSLRCQNVERTSCEYSYASRHRVDLRWYQSPLVTDRCGTRYASQAYILF